MGKIQFFYVKADPHVRAHRLQTVLSRSIVTQSTSHCSSLDTNDVQKVHTVRTLTYHVTSEVPKAIRIRAKLQSSGLWRRVLWMINRFSVKCLSLLLPWRWRQRVPPKHHYAPQRLRDTKTQTTEIWTFSSCGNTDLLHFLISRQNTPVRKKTKGSR